MHYFDENVYLFLYLILNITYVEHSFNLFFEIYLTLKYLNIIHYL